MREECSSNWSMNTAWIPGIGADIAPPRYNVAPGQPILAVVGDGAKNRIGTAEMGVFCPGSRRTRKAVRR
ncbi:MAG: SOS response-associated peptidase [Bacillus subtilis]|nr:SOS response-associated peptidase [Bacillus subtilis]